MLSKHSSTWNKQGIAISSFDQYYLHSGGLQGEVPVFLNIIYGHHSKSQKSLPMSLSSPWQTQSLWLAFDFSFHLRLNHSPVYSLPGCRSLMCSKGNWLHCWPASQQHMPVLAASFNQEERDLIFFALTFNLHLLDQYANWNTHFAMQFSSQNKCKMHRWGWGLCIKMHVLVKLTYRNTLY